MKYTLKQYPEKRFTDKMDMIRFAKKNMQELLFLKKSEYKTGARAVGITAKEIATDINVNTGMVIIKAVINTTNIIDDHLDLHAGGIWNKTVADNPHTYHLQEHERLFSHVISPKARQYNELTNFNKLGLSIDFHTTANINEFVLERKRNPLMFDRYVNGEVSQHSVGMMYVNLSFAYHDEDDEKELNFFNERLKEAVNPEAAIEHGYFWYVSEAKKREGSAVVFGSNSVTPTLSIRDYEPQTSTRKDEPPNGTRLKLTDFMN